MLAPDAYRAIRIEKQGNGVALATLNRPEKRNAVDDTMHGELGRLPRDADADPEVKVLLITGAGRAFCAGGDVGSMGGVHDVAAGRKRTQTHQQMIVKLHRLEKPVIAAVRGPAAGIGFSLALACDLIVASESAYFLAAFKNVGIPPDGGAVFLLTQHLGISRAKEIAYTARRVPAQEAREMGFVTKIVPDERLEPEAQGLAADLAGSATFALRLAKKMFHSMYVPTLEMLLEMESLAIGGARLTHDHAEGVAAFKEKRKPRFTGR